MNKLDQKEFENYLEGESDLSRAYAKLSKEEPSSELDNDILDQAKQDINNDSNNIPDNVTKIKKSFFTSGLDSPLAMAAVVVLCVSLVLLIPQDESLLETTDQIILETLPVMADDPESKPKLDHTIQQQAAPIMSKTRSAAAIEIAKPEAMGRTREESFSEKKERQQEAQINETQINETQINETQINEKILSAPAFAPANQSEMKQKVQQDQLEDDSGISSDAAPMEMLEIEAEVAKRRLAKDASTSDQSSPEALSKQVKLLIQKNKIEQAKSVYQQFIALFPEQLLTDWFSDQEISLLLDR